MPYKTILVHLNDERRAPGLIAAGVATARANNAHLVGLSVVPPTIIVPGMDGDPGAVIDEHRISYRAQAQRMRDAFDRATGVIAVPSAEWREVDAEARNPFGLASAVVVEQARCADLVIASQANPDWSLSSHLDVAEALAMESGRPVLILPRSQTSAPQGERIVVAWNGRREAARAAFDALPFLQAAKSVRVIWANPADEAQTAGEVPGVDLCAALARHGVSCEAAGHAQPGAGAGAALLSAVEAFDGDMLVMGCYGHSRLREMVLGGATRHVMTHARVPVLLAH
jgi:nucleotide-binding universal stress UspA family protein